MGPTAAGKTGLAVNLVKSFPLEIVSVDSALVYREMDIGTAKPDVATLQVAPHRLIDIRDPAETYSAAEFREDALIEMSRITTAGKVPLLVGGTMLYFRALSGGLAELPAASPLIRKRIEKQAIRDGWPALHEKLQQIDPEIASRIHPNDSQRIQRALEVYEITGKKFSDLKNAHRESEAENCGYRILRLIVCPGDRKVLHGRIEQRFSAMIQQGFMDEMRRLYQRGDLDPSMPSMRCVGYRQGWSHLAGEIDQQQMTSQSVAATRQLAKRQLTWLRQESDAIWYDPGAVSVQKSVFRDVENFLE